MPNHDDPHTLLKEALFAVYGPRAATLIVADAIDVQKVGVPTSQSSTVHYGPDPKTGLIVPLKVEVGTHRTVLVRNGNGGKKNGR